MRYALPSGVVTFLFADIEGSTELWERSPEAMSGALAEHDAILHDAIERRSGIVFKTVGDAFCAAFSAPGEALSAAVEIQRTLHGHSWPRDVGEIRVRMALHTGECIERDGDYFGPSLNRVSRLLSLAYGRQILVSAATAALLADALRDEVALRDLGEHRLRGLARSERPYQVMAVGLRAEFPALRSPDVHPNNLPQAISTFVGRERELRELDGIFVQCRLLTITGPGGMGKTRLALQFAQEHLDRYAGGVWFVDLTALRDPELVAAKIADELNVREVPNETIEDTLAAHLRDQTLLLVIDNAEQVLSGVAKIVKLLLSQCPRVAALVTSREPLHVAGEQVFRLGALDHHGAALFMERARQAAPALTFGDSEVAAIGDLCAKLEGIPLAIELASARLSSMPLRRLAGALASGLSLASKDSTEASRHRALRETIAWSYDLLAPGEQRVLALLAIFRGSCSFDAAASIAESDDVDDLLDSLVDKSLALVDDVDGDPRYRLLLVVREFAAEKIRGAGDYDAVAQRHADYYAALATTLRGLESTSGIEDDLPNFRAAIEWQTERQPAKAVELIAALAPFWRVHGSVTEGRSWIDAAAAVRVDARDRGRLLCLSASFATLQDDLDDSLRHSHEAVEIFRTLRDPAGEAEALFRVAEVEHRQGHLDEAERHYYDALRGFVACGHARGEMLCTGNLGIVARQRGAFGVASARLAEAIARANALQDGRLSSEFAMAQGWVQRRFGELAESRATFENALAERAAAQDRYGVCCARHALASLGLAERRLSEARSGFLETLRGARELRIKDYIARALHGAAAIEVLEGDAETAARFLGLADRLFAESGRELVDSLDYDEAVALIETRLSAARRSALAAEGARMHVDDAVAMLEVRWTDATPR
ncbi:MAG TPA: adenylate/guanylate cyclase domain-containing protein [Candidatus Cybelea sp.]|nr:adenylate/guanylate cyclase domain-containing protein [Candidatus Cybelea sp.]